MHTLPGMFYKAQSNMYTHTHKHANKPMHTIMHEWSLKIRLWKQPQHCALHTKPIHKNAGWNKDSFVRFRQGGRGSRMKFTWPAVTVDHGPNVSTVETVAKEAGRSSRSSAIHVVTYYVSTFYGTERPWYWVLFRPLVLCSICSHRTVSKALMLL